jgi:hypothetical protein
MPWEKILWLALCAGLLWGSAACSEKAEIRPKSEVLIGGSVKSRH